MRRHFLKHRIHKIQNPVELSSVQHTTQSVLNDIDPPNISDYEFKNTSPVLILVHIGDVFPEYLNVCIAQLQQTSSIEIHVLISSKHTTKIVSQTVKIFTLESIPQSLQHTYFMKTSKLDVSFRNGFWRNATLRFFIMYDHVLNNNLENIFHIEYDNLIFHDFTKYLQQFQTKRMWCVMDSTKRCIPSFLYFKDVTILHELLNTCRKCASQQIDDMSAVGQFRNSHLSDVGVLPIISSYCEPIDKMFFENYSLFGCVFDAAAVGQYIGGVDPRNTAGNTIGFVNPDSIINTSKIQISWENKAPFVNNNPLVNLHVHSKDLQRWCNIE